MMVKICGITNREDAEAAAEGGASALGFNFWPRSPRYIAPDRAAPVLENLPPRVSKVGVFVNEQFQTVERLMTELGLDVAQLHGRSTPGAASFRVWRAVAVGPEFQLSELEDEKAEAFLLDAPAGDRHGGTGQTFDWSLVAGAATKIIVAGGLDASNVRAAIRTARPWGVDACSRLESAPGKKDHGKMAEFLKAALSENV